MANNYPYIPGCIVDQIPPDQLDSYEAFA